MPGAATQALEVHTLTDGGQQPADVAALLATFVAAAERTLDIAIYDFKLSPAVAAPIVEAVHTAVGRGVVVRLAYDRDHALPIPVPPPPDVEKSLVDSLGAEVRVLAGVPDLMHHKYVLRDGRSLWTGSTNWTDDSWRREENVIVIAADAPDLVAQFERDFEELWQKVDVAGSGEWTTTDVTVGGSNVRPWFCPGRGRKLAHRIADAIGTATRRVRVASPVITAGPVLATLAQIIADKKVDVGGVYDATQMRQVIHQWRADGRVPWKIPTFQAVQASGLFGGKVTTPYGPGTVHDYMHAKMTVADDRVFVGSYNLSGSGQQNAENVLEITDPALAERMAAYIDQVRARYPVTNVPKAAPLDR